MNDEILDKLDKNSKYLMRQIKNGDYEAAGKLFSIWKRPLYIVLDRYIRKFSKYDLEPAEDEVSETFYKILKSAHTFKGNGTKFSNWIFRIGLHLVIDDIRKKKKMKNTGLYVNVDGEDLPRYIIDETNIENQIIDGDILSAVKEEIERLDPKFSIPLTMQYYEGKKYEEISEATGLPLGTVKGRISRGKERMKERLHKKYPKYFN